MRYPQHPAQSPWAVRSLEPGGGAFIIGTLVSSQAHVSSHIDSWSQERVESSEKGLLGQWAACETTPHWGVAMWSFNPCSSDVKLLSLPEQQGWPWPRV